MPEHNSVCPLNASDVEKNRMLKVLAGSQGNKFRRIFDYL